MSMNARYVLVASISLGLVSVASPVEALEVSAYSDSGSMGCLTLKFEDGTRWAIAEATASAGYTVSYATTLAPDGWVVAVDRLLQAAVWGGTGSDSAELSGTTYGILKNGEYSESVRAKSTSEGVTYQDGDAPPWWFGHGDAYAYAFSVSTWVGSPGGSDEDESDAPEASFYCKGESNREEKDCDEDPYCVYECTPGAGLWYVQDWNCEEIDCTQEPDHFLCPDPAVVAPVVEEVEDLESDIPGTPGLPGLPGVPSVPAVPDIQEILGNIHEICNDKCDQIIWKIGSKVIVQEVLAE